MSAFDDACDRVLGRLEERGVGVRVVGAAALAAHGVSRSTRDLDLLVVDRTVLGGPKDRWDIVSLLEGVADRQRLVEEVDQRIGSMRPSCHALWVELRRV